MKQQPVLLHSWTVTLYIRIVWCRDEYRR